MPTQSKRSAHHSSCTSSLLYCCVWFPSSLLRLSTFLRPRHKCCRGDVHLQRAEISPRSEIPRFRKYVGALSQFPVVREHARENHRRRCNHNLESAHELKYYHVRNHSGGITSSGVIYFLSFSFSIRNINYKGNLVISFRRRFFLQISPKKTRDVSRDLFSRDL